MYFQTNKKKARKIFLYIFVYQPYKAFSAHPLRPDGAAGAPPVKEIWARHFD
jgi:hypothetical protein